MIGIKAALVGRSRLWQQDPVWFRGDNFDQACVWRQGAARFCCKVLDRAGLAMMVMGVVAKLRRMAYTRAACEYIDRKA